MIYQSILAGIHSAVVMHQTNSDTEGQVKLPLREVSIAALNLYLSLFTILTISDVNNCQYPL